MKKKITLTLIVLSAVLLLLGLISGTALAYQVMHGVQNPIYVDGTDFSGLFRLFGAVTSAALILIHFLYFAGAVAVIWAVYGIVLLILKIVQRTTQDKPPKN